jgi:hypothetical protein
MIRSPDFTLVAVLRDRGAGEVLNDTGSTLCRTGVSLHHTLKRSTSDCSWLA